jgi:hypothetical protein
MATFFSKACKQSDRGERSEMERKVGERERGEEGRKEMKNGKVSGEREREE